MRNGDWFQTYTGMKFYPIDPHPDDISILDIAHALANICRFGGHTTEFYSVAQHSVMVSFACQHDPLQALMHDATEAYVGDMIRPLKNSIPEYRVIEDRVWEAICEKFNIEKQLNPEVKRADNRALMTERRDMLLKTTEVWSMETEFPPFKNRIIPLSYIEAEGLFLNVFGQLTNTSWIRCGYRTPFHPYTKESFLLP